MNLATIEIKVSLDLKDFSLWTDPLPSGKIGGAFSDFSEAQVSKLFSELKESKAALGIPNKLINIAAQPLAKPFAYIFNECIFTGVVPDVLKWSQVTPIHKNGPTTDPTNYRPIAILSPFSKVLEKLVYDQLYSFLEKMKSSRNISLDLGKTFPLNKPYLN